MASSFFRGTSTDQDPRFKDKQAMLLKKMQFPPSFDQKVDMRKVEIAVMKPWIAKKTVELLGFEDDVLIEYINSLLEDTDNPIVDAKNLQVLLTGFLEKKTPTFMESLWTLLLSAQSNPLRVPTELLEEKKREMRERETQEAIKRRQAEQLDEVRRREREGRAGPAGGGGGFEGSERPRGAGGYGGRGGERFEDRERGGYGRGGPGGGFQARERDSGYGPRGGGGGSYRDDYRRCPASPSPRPFPLPSPAHAARPFPLPSSSQAPSFPLVISLAVSSVAQQGKTFSQPEPEQEPGEAGQGAEARAVPFQEDQGRRERQPDRLSSSKWAQDDEADDQQDLQRRESELKEGLLRKKVEASRAQRDKQGGGGDQAGLSIKGAAAGGDA
ncbi:hypothetical protein JCM1841_005303 [Sporobolomyces salmonicolor]